MFTVLALLYIYAAVGRSVWRAWLRIVVAGTYAVLYLTIAESIRRMNPVAPGSWTYLGIALLSLWLVALLLQRRLEHRSYAGRSTGSRD